MIIICRKGERERGTYRQTVDVVNNQYLPGLKKKGHLPMH